MMCATKHPVIPNFRYSDFLSKSCTFKFTLAGSPWHFFSYSSSIAECLAGNQFLPFFFFLCCCIDFMQLCNYRKIIPLLFSQQIFVSSSTCGWSPITLITSVPTWLLFGSRFFFDYPLGWRNKLWKKINFLFPFIFLFIYKKTLQII